MRPGLQRGLQITAALLAVQLAATSFLACQRAEEPVLMPAAGGALTDLGIQFSRVDGQRFLAVYEQLFAALDPDTRVHVVVGDASDREAFEAARRSWAAAPEVTYTLADRPITSWMRDRLAVLGGSEHSPTLLAPPSPMAGPEARANDWWVPWVVADSDALPGGATVRTSSFQFEGGDLISDGEHVFVAPPLWARNPDLDRDEVLARVAAETGLEVVPIGLHDPVPDHHIGMFLTPLGQGRVAVADADLGLAAIGEADSLVVGGEPLAIDRSAERRARFRQVATDLERAGFEVVPLPIVPAQQRYVMLSSNNALLEHRQGALHVYMPAYDVDALDRAATQAWTDAGAVVHPIDVTTVFRLGGSVRCLTAPLGRSYQVP